MKAKKVYEFIQSKSLKNSVKDDIGIIAKQKNKIKNWLNTYILGSIKDFEITNNLNLKIHAPSHSINLINYNEIDFPFNKVIFTNNDKSLVNSFQLFNAKYITKIPDLENVNEIYLQGLFNLEYLPKIIDFRDDLQLLNLYDLPKLKKLPKNIIYNNLVISNVPEITKLPEDLTILNYLYLGYLPKLKEIPESLTARKIHLNHVNLKIPKQLEDKISNTGEIT